VLFFGAAPAMGSWWGLIPAALLVPGLAWRLIEEEAYLVRNLPGYEDYRRKVRWRLAPFIW
jgi:protein-S-isoprenylcysteine O-methyltransferase Ste14